VSQTNPFPIWTWLEWQGQRAHFMAVLGPGRILVEHLDGTQDAWPWNDDVRVLGGVDRHAVEEALVTLGIK
jgi:hypothetical protein